MDYGAVGDGIANDTAAFQAGLDAIKAAGGGTLIIPAGSWRLGAASGNINPHLQVYDNTTVQADPKANITGGIVANQLGDGIHLVNSNGGSISQIQVSANQGIGIALDNATNFQVNGTNESGNYYAAVEEFLNSNYNTISGNTVDGNNLKSNGPAIILLGPNSVSTNNK